MEFEHTIVGKFQSLDLPFLTELQKSVTTHYVWVFTLCRNLESGFRSPFAKVKGKGRLAEMGCCLV